MFGVDDLIAGGISAIGGMFTNSMNNDAAMARQTDAQNFNAAEAEKNRQFQTSQVQQQESFQTQMSNTAYQRARQDMLAAGLNPILAANSPASAPSGAAMGGSQASASPVFNRMDNPLDRAVSTAIQHKAMQSAVDLQAQQTENAKYQADNIQADTAQRIAQERQTNQATKNMETEGQIKNEVLQSAVAEAAKAKTDTEFYQSPAGRILRLIGVGGREVGSAVSAVPVLGNAAKTVSNIYKNFE